MWRGRYRVRILTDAAVTLRGGHVVVLAAAFLAVFASGEAAPSSHVRPSLLDQVNGVRRQLGLQPLRPDPVVRPVVERMAVNDHTDRAPEVLDAQPDCAVCDLYFEDGRARDPRVHYHSLGGRSLIRFGLWRSGWTAAQNLSVFYRTAALLLDPRARTFTSVRTPLGMLVVGVTGDSKARFTRPVRWPLGDVDPRHQLWIQVLLPPGQGYPHLYDVRGGRVVTTAYPLAAARGLGGSRLVTFGLNTSLAYGRTYHVGTGRLELPLHTRTMPETFRQRSWSFQSVTTTEREAFLGVVSKTPPLLQRLLGDLDGAVTVVGGSRGCRIADACEQVDGDRATIGIASGAEPFVALHELGHVLFDLALDERARGIFRTGLRRAGWNGACCFSFSEGFADQLAFWALDEVPAGLRTYSDRMYISSEEFTSFLHAHAGYRPKPVQGLLPR
jgi:hypothetical protein